MLLHFSGSERQYNDAKIKKLKTFNLYYKTYMYILYQVFLKVVVCVLFLYINILGFMWGIYILIKN